MPPKSTPGALLGVSPSRALAPQFWGTLECILPPKLAGATGAEGEDEELGAKIDFSKRSSV
jgi:hypothetical protein